MLTSCPRLSVSPAWYIFLITFLFQLSRYAWVRKFGRSFWTNNPRQTTLILMPPLKMLGAA
ncbi:hypothetical protein BDR03DRAFT_962564 [Suillus americanus]|nr:hypothetical protein BDR03DRAFT_962564 [Suillus americanus]